MKSVWAEGDPPAVKIAIHESNRSMLMDVWLGDVVEVWWQRLQSLPKYQKHQKWREVFKSALLKAKCPLPRRGNHPEKSSAQKRSRLFLTRPLVSTDRWIE